VHPGRGARGPRALAEDGAPAIARRAQVGEHRPARLRGTGDQQAQGVAGLAGLGLASGQRRIPHRDRAGLDRDGRHDPVRVGQGRRVAQRGRALDAEIGDPPRCIELVAQPVQFRQASATSSGSRDAPSHPASSASIRARSASSMTNRGASPAVS